MQDAVHEQLAREARAPTLGSQRRDGPVDEYENVVHGDTPTASTKPTPVPTPAPKASCRSPAVVVDLTKDDDDDDEEAPGLVPGRPANDPRVGAIRRVPWDGVRGGEGATAPTSLSSSGDEDDMEAGKRKVTRKVSIKVIKPDGECYEVMGSAEEVGAAIQKHVNAELEARRNKVAEELNNKGFQFLDLPPLPPLARRSPTPVVPTSPSPMPKWGEGGKYLRKYPVPEEDFVYETPLELFKDFTVFRARRSRERGETSPEVKVRRAAVSPAEPR